MSTPLAGLSIMLDPGHGGARVWGRSTPQGLRGATGLREEELTLDLARRVREDLEGDGAAVALTRRGDQGLSLRARAQAARAAGARVFLSLHLGGREDPVAGGALTCIHHGASPRSEALALAVHDAVLSATGSEDLGLRRGPLAVLDPALHAPETACCLIEPCMLTNPSEEQRLRDPAYRQRLAGAIGRAVRSWFRAETPGASAQRAPVSTLDHELQRRAAVVVAVPTPGRGFAQRDAEEVAALLQRRFRVPQEALRLLVGEAASAAAVREAIAELARALPPQGDLLVYASAPGPEGPHEGLAFCGADGELVRAEALVDLAEATGLRRLTVLTELSALSAPPPAAALGTPSTGPVELRWLNAASPGQLAQDHPGSSHGLFTAALLQRLDRPDPEISMGGLAALLCLDVEHLAQGLEDPSPQRPSLLCGPAEGLLLGGDTRATAPLPLRHYVPLVPQMTGMSCWAASAAMIIGWRRLQAFDGQTVAVEAAGWEPYRRGLRPTDVEKLAEVWGLVIEPPRVWSVGELWALLRRFGPLWIGEADPDLHVVVLYGLHGDGTIDGTQVEIADPWPVGQGERYTLTFRELMDNFHAATQLVGLHAQVLHAGDGAEHSVPEHSVPEHSVPEHSVPEHSVPEHSVPEHSVPEHTDAQVEQREAPDQ